MELVRFEKTQAVLQQYADDLHKIYVENLRGSERRASEMLINSVHTAVVFGGTSIAVDLQVQDYFKYVEWDTKPHWPPSGCLLNWIQAKPILPTPDADGKLPTSKQLDYLIRRKISQEGTKGSHDLEEAVAQVNATYGELIADAVAEDLGSAADGIIETFFR